LRVIPQTLFCWKFTTIYHLTMTHSTHSPSQRLASTAPLDSVTASSTLQRPFAATVGESRAVATVRPSPETVVVPTTLEMSVPVASWTVNVAAVMVVP